MKAGFENKTKNKEENEKNKIKINKMLNNSNPEKGKQENEHRYTLANIRHFNMKKKKSKKSFVNLCSQIRYNIHKLVDNIYSQIIVLLIAIYSLFYMEILLLSLPDKYDKPMHFAIEVFFFVLFGEFLICLTTKNKYIFSFDFYVDLLSLIGLMPEVTLIWDPIMNLIAGDTQYE